MTAIALPRPRRRKSKKAQVAQAAAKVWASMKIGSAATTAARKGAKAWGSWKVTKFLGRRGKKVLIVPIAAGGGVLAWRKARSGPPETTPGSTYPGPAGSGSTVPPPAAPDLERNGEGAPGSGGTPPPGSTS